MEGGFLREMYRRNVANVKENLSGALHSNVPMRQGSYGRLQEPWCTKAVKNLVKKKRKASKRFRELGNVRNLEEYMTSRKELKREIRRARRGHEKPWQTG